MLGGCIKTCESADDVTALGYTPSTYFNTEDAIQEAIIFLNQCLERRPVTIAHTTQAAVSIPKITISKFDEEPDLVNSSIQKYGFRAPNLSWPCEVSKEPKDLSEQKTIRTVLTTSAVTDHFIDRIDHRNSFTHLKRIIATVLRAIQCFKGKRVGHRFLSVAELEEALTLIIRHMQVKEFKAEIKQLRRERPIDSKSKLTKLTPFLDNNSIIRVGGRLRNASIPYTAKHPAILPTSHPFTKLLLVDLHKDNLHIATQALRATARQKFWILQDKGLASAVVHECVQCSRLNPQTFKQLMGTLPDARVQPARPFINVGIDFCGPVFTHYKIRRKRSTKTYICLFRCFTTKACQLYFKMNTPRSLTYEELCTVTTEAEAVLNSRPILPLSEDPNDMTALTPGYFLIGEPLTTTIHNRACGTNPNLLTRLKLMQHIRHEFWRRWSIEYLCELQRVKWNLGSDNWQLGRIVKTIPGSDGRCSVADVKTSSGIFRRAIHKLCPLVKESETLSKANPATSDEYTEKINPKRLKKYHPNRGRFLPINSNWSTTRKEKEPESVTTEGLRRRRRSTSMLATALITLLILPIVRATFSPKIVTPFTKDPGIYFETIGQAKLITTEWNIITFYDPKNYCEELDGIRKGISNMKEFCAAVTIQGQGDEERNYLTRNRRSPLDIVGNIANKLFGILDSDYAAYLEGEIEKSRANEHYLHTLMKNQTSLLETTTNLFKTERNHIQEQFKAIHDYLKQHSEGINSATQQEIFTTYCIRTMMALQTYQDTQRALWDIMLDLQHGTINPLLVTPQQLQEQITLIQKTVPPNLRIPISRTIGDLSLYKTFSVHAKMAKSFVILQLKLPLINSEEFQLFSLLPVPIQRAQRSYLIQTSTRYLLVNLQRSQHYPIIQDELDKCGTTGDNIFLFMQDHPLYNKQSSINQCELALKEVSTIRNKTHPRQTKNRKKGFIFFWTGSVQGRGGCLIIYNLVLSLIIYHLLLPLILHL
ncbi:unnamed protein product [Hermetia illucens]|uniref:DUF5641 domain-containing protein n=1 Tax=Hermetia illucens TaxID=343691 RepID=A0A7R8UQX6_HERIL|nr:unnamed protein product [Hermetia illucens]